jgi:hypothetical protein
VNRRLTKPENEKEEKKKKQTEGTRESRAM